MSKNTEVCTKVVINEAGGDKITLEQSKTNGKWYAGLSHNCNTIGEGVTYLLEKHEDVKKLLDQYNTKEDC